MTEHLYFVRADKFGFCEFAGHWLAETPKAAIAIAQATMVSQSGLLSDVPYDPANYQWSARRSKAKPEDMALNYVRIEHTVQR